MARHIHARHALLRAGLGVAAGWLLLAPGHAGQQKSEIKKTIRSRMVNLPHILNMY
jgi:hypothetical protein